MEEPWLDSLSEDWDPEPRSSPASLPSFGTPTASTRSRIPRYSHSSLNGSSNRSSPRNQAVTKSHRALSERSVSDNNIPAHSSPAADPPRHGSLKRANTISSSSSTGSVMKDGSVLRRSKSSSSAKNRTGTPEWKKLVLNGGKSQAAQTNLFSPKPISLESIFQRPADGFQQESSPARTSMTLFESLPSSPPPWPKDHRGAQMTFRSMHLPPADTPLDTVLEEDDEKSDPLVQEERPSPLTADNTQPPPEREDQTAPESKGPRDNVRWIPQAVPSSNSISSSAPESEHDMSIPEGLARSRSTAQCPSATYTQASSSTTGGFSPVFISKHNTHDGSVGYAAVDLSNPQTAELIRSYATSSSQKEACSDGVEAASKKETRTSETQQPLNFSSSQKGNTTPLPMLSPFVNFDRGGYSDQGSFHQRPLSPSASSSILPSDSVSQIGYNVDTSQRLLSPIFARSIIDRRVPTKPTSRKPSGDSVQTANRDVSVSRDDASANGSGTAPSLETVLHRSDNDYLDQTLPISQPDSAPAEHDRPSTPEALFVHKGRDEQQQKRPNSTSTKGPTPKRIRTLGGNLESLLTAEHVSDTVKEQHRRMQAMLGKRKDARYDDDDDASVDADTVARRAILRPRIPTPAQMDRLLGLNPDEPPSSELMMLQEDLDRFPLPNNVQNPAELRTLATKVATIRINALRQSDDNRKPSVSTQDYVDEAMKIMEYIRARRQAQEDLAGVSELEESEERSEVDYSQTLARPPSRDGAASAWRTNQQGPFDPKVMSQLQQYQETGDESFLVSSVLENMQEDVAQSEHDPTSNEDEDELGPIQTEADLNQSPHIRVTGPLPNWTERVLVEESSVKTHSSHHSMDSNKTVQTNVSQRSRAVPNIPPDKVTHLLDTNLFGMRFDTEKNTWVRMKRKATSTNISSSTGTEDDPFMNIPDLSINDRSDLGGPPRKLDVQTRGALDEQTAAQPSTNEDLDDAREEDSQELEALPSSDVNMPKVAQEAFVTANPVSDPDRDGPDTQHILAKEPGKAMQSTQREPSMALPTSPPPAMPVEQVSARQAHDEQQVESLIEDLLDEEESFDEPDSLIEDSIIAVKRPTARASNLPGTYHQHQAISISRTRADGRSMSLTLSMSTPLPGVRQTTMQIMPSSGLKHSLWQSMSPLSDFSLHQNDARHLRASHIDQQPRQQLVSLATRVPAPVVVSDLVKTITDAQPDEPYWELMEDLQLIGKGLDNLHMLDDFCPKLVQLKADDNALKHLDGVPSAVRELTLLNNALSSLTSWDHLMNLQYLDLSGNQLNDLKGLGGLVHLRELKADNNSISDIEGVFDLDGLLTLSLRHNNLGSVDFGSSNLSRLSKLDMSSNQLNKVVSLHSLPGLETLELSSNGLVAFPSDASSARPCLILRSLQLSNNSLSTMDVTQFPDLQTLNLDDNSLSSIVGISQHRNLETLSLRSQTETSKSLADALPSFSEIRHLHLSGNPLSALPSTITSTNPFLNTQTLELALCGLQTLPQDFALTFPNLRTLNLNFNALRDIRPLRGLKKLSALHLAGNRIGRLRRTVSVLSTLSSSLVELDLRDNPLLQGFYPPSSFGSIAETTRSNVGRESTTLVNANTDHQPCQKQADSQREMRLRHALPPSTLTQEQEEKYTSTLDRNTRLRKRVYGIVLSSLCGKLERVDGRDWSTDAERDGPREALRSKDGAWEDLVEMGVIEQL